MKTLDDIALSENERDAVREAAALLRRQYGAERIVLFGSKARAQGDHESDIDLLVLTRKRMSRAERRQITDALFELQLSRAVVIDTFVVSSDEWEHGAYQVLPIRAEIERDGVAA